MSGQGYQRGGEGWEDRPVPPPPEGNEDEAAGLEEPPVAAPGFEPLAQSDEDMLSEGRASLVNELERERDEYKDRLLRLQAEFDNYRKRIDRQQKDMAENAASSLVKKLLPVLDTADLALAHGGGEEVKQVASTLFDVLAKEGLQRVDPEGKPFDPEHHDAVAHEPAEGDKAPEVPEVSEVLRAGYEWKGRVLRPAMVKVRG